MTPGFEPFHRAAVAAPTDDLPKLIAADWLDENGDPERAAFIRQQIAGVIAPVAYRRTPRGWKLHQRPKCPFGSRYNHGARAALTEPLPVTFAQVDRGFVAQVWLPLDDFLKHAAELCAAHPIRGAWLSDRKPYRHATGIFLWGKPTVPEHSPNYPTVRQAIPAALWRFLPATSYRTEQEAMADLALAAARYGHDAAKKAAKKAQAEARAHAADWTLSEPDDDGPDVIPLRRA